MLKSLALSLMTVLFGAAAAQAACNGSCCTQAAHVLHCGSPGSLCG